MFKIHPEIKCFEENHGNFFGPPFCKMAEQWEIEYDRLVADGASVLPTKAVGPQGEIVKSLALDLQFSSPFLELATFFFDFCISENCGSRNFCNNRCKTDVCCIKSLKNPKTKHF